MSGFSTAASVLADVDRVRQHIAGYGCAASVEARVVGRDCAVFTLELRPYPELVPAGYPVEILRVAIWRDGTIHGIPSRSEDDRAWRHRNPGVFRELCLWYERDPRGLRWAWGDDLLEYIAIAHRHLIAEEYCRRHGHWPVEDAPHGHPAGGGAHPIVTGRLRLVKR